MTDREKDQLMLDALTKIKSQATIIDELENKIWVLQLEVDGLEANAKGVAQQGPVEPKTVSMKRGLGSLKK